MLVSHDRHLLRVTVDTLLLVDGGGVAPFDGDLDDYPAWLAARDPDREGARTGAGWPRRGGSASSSAARRRTCARACNPCAIELQALEQRLADLDSPAHRTGARPGRPGDL